MGTSSTVSEAPAPASYAETPVASAMITRPHLHPADLDVGAAREALTDPHVHLLLLVEADGRLVGTVDRDDLAAAADADPTATVRAFARLDGRTAHPDAPLAAVRAQMDLAGTRRVAVVDDDGLLRGLLCLKRSGRGWCTDAGVAARAADPTARRR